MKTIANIAFGQDWAKKNASWEKIGSVHLTNCLLCNTHNKQFVRYPFHGLYGVFVDNKSILYKA